MARILHVPDPGTTVHDIDELPYRLGGRAHKPSRALAWRGQHGNTTLIHGLGVTEAAEIQDMAYALHDKQNKFLFETQAQRRERVGLPTVQETLQNISNAMQHKADWFKQNASQHQANYDPTQRTLF
jgi:hypothetical protein